MQTVINANHDIWISKRLSWLLRHGALKKGLTLSSDGFIPILEILPHLKLCSIEDIKRIVENNDKQRFALRTNEQGVLEIRANQGHSIAEVVDLELKIIDDHRYLENVIHGTYFRYWDSIKRQGLFRGQRNHIHFGSDLGTASGIRKSAEIYIYIDLEKALSAGLLFYLSSNNVVLCPGNDTGFILPEFFLKVCTNKGVVLVF